MIKSTAEVEAKVIELLYRSHLQIKVNLLGLIFESINSDLYKTVKKKI